MILLKEIGIRKSDTAQRGYAWGLFHCDICGHDVERAIGNGVKAKSCGCNRMAGKTKHGLAKTGQKHPLFNVWINMRSRCNDPQAHHYRRYGGRGISVCAEWKENFEAFFKWAIANGWQRNLQLDRIDNNGNYSPCNCRFVTPQVNVWNSTVSKLTIDQVTNIRNNFLKWGKNYEEVGAMFGVTGVSISNIMRFKTWA